MSLEELMSKNNELLTEHNELLRTIIGSAKKNTGSGDETAAKAAKTTKGKGATKDKDADNGDDAFDAKKLEAARAKASAWLGEFKANEADPETEERKTKFRAALEKLGYQTVKDINKAEDVDRFDKWVDTQISKGRITPEPSEDDAAADEDDI